MTLLAAVHDGKSALVAADSLGVWPGEGYGESVDKLYRLGTQSVVWGYYGGSEQGDQYIEAVRRCVDKRAFLSWDDLTYWLHDDAEALDRQYAVKGGFTALFAGCIKGEWRIAAFGAHQLTSPEGDWCFVGKNRLSAKVAWQSVAAVPNTATQEERMSQIMDATISAGDPYLGLPLNMYRITPNQCVRVSPLNPAQEYRIVNDVNVSPACS